MKLEVQEAKVEDIENAKAIYGPETGDLCAAAFAVGWPSDPNDTEAAKLRVQWSCQQQREILENDATTRFVKVVDADNNDELVAFGRWHRYTSGYERIGDLEIAGLKNRNDPSTWPTGFINKAFYIGFLDELFECLLTNVKTRESLQKNGAGSLILKWGLEQAAKEGVPAYLEAVVQAMHLYESHGFREIDRQSVDCTQYGMQGVIFEVARMRAVPK